MEDLSCPFCHKDVPNGAFVCTGCQAEIGYNEPTWLGALIIKLGFVLGVLFGFALLFVTVYDRGFGTKSFFILGLR